MKPWITQRITELLGFEDDIVIDFCITHLENVPETGLDPKMLQIQLTGFMERKAAPFVSELWQHLLSAQDSPVGVPQEFIDKKKEDLKAKKQEAERVQEEIKKRKSELEAANSGGKTENTSNRRVAQSRSRSRSNRRR